MRKKTSKIETAIQAELKKLEELAQKYGVKLEDKKTELVAYPCPKCGKYFLPYMHSINGYAFMVCPEHGQFKTSVAVSVNFRRFCSKVGSQPNREQGFYTSSEEKIRRFLLKRGLVEGLDFVHNARIGPIINEKGNKVYYWVDFLIPSYKLIIECSPKIWHCYDKETEVLTSKGFKYFKDLKKNDMIAVLKNGYLTYEYPEEIQSFCYKGKMFSLEMASISLKVTPNHYLYLAKGRASRNPFTLIEAKDCPKIFELKRDARWKGITPKYFTLPNTDLKIPIKQWLKFFAWFITEGSLWKSRKGDYKIIISQQKYKSYLRRFFSKFPFFNFKEDSQGFYCYSRCLFLYLKQFGKAKEKYLPQEIKELSPKLLRYFIKELIKGDGSGSGLVYYTSSKRLRDDIWEIALKAGLAVSDSIDTRKIGRFGGPVYKITLSEFYKTPRHERKDCRKWVDYEGPVYCVTVPSHVIFVRRNGKGCWCGNSMWNRQEADKRKEQFVTSKGWTIIHLDEKDVDQLNLRRKKSKYPKSERVLKLYEIFNCKHEYVVENGNSY